MTTTNLTLTNGATSEISMVVTSVTFEVDSKLAVNPAVTFPFTVAINSSEVMGIDFDETLHTGDYTEQITINVLGGHDIVHTVNMVDTSLPTNMIRDGDFALGTADEWDDESGGSDTTFDTNQAVITDGGAWAQYLMQHDIGVSDVAGVQYLIEFDILDYIDGEIGMCLGQWGAVDSGAEYFTGAQHVSTVHTTADGNTDGFMLYGGEPGANMTIDNITVKEL